MFKKAVKMLVLVSIICTCLGANFQGPVQAQVPLGTVYLPLVLKPVDPNAPRVEITWLPECQTTQNLTGKVYNVVYEDFNIVAYIRVRGAWWLKPYFLKPLTQINSSGEFTVDVTTGGEDTIANSFAVFLIPKGYNPPTVGGAARLPDELFTNSVAYVILDRVCP